MNGKPQLSEVFFALSDPTRIEVVRLLAHDERRASELAEQLGASRPGMSRHLRILRDARLVLDHGDPDDGRAQLLAINRDGFVGLASFLQEVTQDWQLQLESFKATAERAAKGSARGKASGQGAQRRKRAS